MTDDPPRLLDEGTLTPDEQRALEVGTHDRSPLGAKAAIWTGLSLKLLVPATAAAATLTAAAGSSSGVVAASGAGAGAAGLLTTMALVKSAGIGLALGAAVGSGLYFSSRPEPTPPAPHELVVVEGATSVAAPFHSAAATPNAPAAAESASSPAPSGASEPRGDSTRAERPREAPPVESESQRVARARAWLRSGDANRALQTLDALERDEPNGLLAQEREALAIEALAALGRRDAARARADAFLERYPRSPHVLAVRRAAGYLP
jgi:hypothetical protein